MTAVPDVAAPVGRQRRWASVGAAVVVGHLLLAVVVPLLPLQSVTAQDATAILQGASSRHWLGTDDLGRDVLARTLWGGRPSIAIAAAAAVLAALLGGVIGAVAALARGWVDDVLMRVNDVLLALPSLLVLMLVASFIGRQPAVLVAALALMYAPPVARLVRGAALGVLERDFVVAARLGGASSSEIVIGEVLPNIRRVVATEVAMQFSWILLAFSALSFLGLGATPPTPEWGLMVSSARNYITINALPLIAPAAMLASLVLAVNALVDRDAHEERR